MIRPDTKSDIFAKNWRFVRKKSHISEFWTQISSGLAIGPSRLLPGVLWQRLARSGKAAVFSGGRRTATIAATTTRSPLSSA